MWLGISLLKPYKTYKMSKRNMTNSWLVRPVLLFPREADVCSLPGKRFFERFVAA